MPPAGVHRYNRHMSRSLLVVAALGLVTLTTLPLPALAAASHPLSHQADNAVPGEVIIGLPAAVDFTSLNPPAGALQTLEKVILGDLQVVVLRVLPGQEEKVRAAMLAQPAVLFAERKVLVEVQALPNDPYYAGAAPFPSGQYAPARVQAPDAWDQTTGSPDVILAIVDSGLDVSHPEFQGRLMRGYDFVQGDAIPQDSCGHGTHITGIAAASGDNAQGIAGMDWNARILPVRVLGSDCLGDPVDIARGIVYATDQGADIINLSLGLLTASRVLEYATYYAYSRGAAVIAAAGNHASGSPPLSVFYPAAYPWVLAVGATAQAAGNPVADFSNQGAALDLVAPGEAILGTLPQSSGFSLQGSNALGTHYGVLDGTSMAAALASGAASLLMAHNPDFNTPERIYAGLQQTALDLGAPGQDAVYGHGLLQVADALGFDPSGLPPPQPPPATAVEYDTLSSSRCQNIRYAWREIPHIDLGPNRTNLGIFNNNGSALVALPFPIEFGGAAFTEATVSANGYVSFDGLGSEQENWLIPQSDAGPPYARPNWYVAPFWDDLNPSAAPPEWGAGVYGAVMSTPVGDEYVIEWYRVPIQQNNSSTELTFQVVFIEATGQILFQYKTLKGSQSDGSSATIGLEYDQGRRGQLYAFDQSGAVSPKSAILFSPQIPGSDRQVPGCLLVTEVDPAVTARFDLAPWCLQFPSGAVSQPATLRFSVFNTFSPRFANFLSLGHYAEITLEPQPPAPFSPRPMVCYIYTAGDLAAAGGKATNLFLASYDLESGVWERLPTGIDTLQRTLFSPVAHFSVFGVFTSPRPSEPPVTGAARPGVIPIDPVWLLLPAWLIWRSRPWRRP